jgi:pyruvate dehydrogenase E1 component alpha subunit
VASAVAPSAKTKKADTVENETGESLDLLLHLYKEMLHIRRFEEAAFQQYQKGAIGGFCHLYIGQEAVCVGAISCLEKGDKVLTGYRDHGHALALGMSANSLMAELFAKITGCAKGKGGSMHFFDDELGMLGGNGIVGSHIPVAAGVAFAQKYKNEKKVTLGFYGDGAAQQGAVHEAMNLAGLWRLPVIFVLENNKYGMGTAVARSSATSELYKRAEAYNFPGVTCDGMDVLQVRKCFSEAIARARFENTPTLIEVRTYRYRGHSMSDPASYRTAEEVEQKKKEDPILMLKSVLLSRGVAEPKLAAIDEAAKAEATASVEFAIGSPEPDYPEIACDVVANPWDAKMLPRIEIEP